MKSVCLLAIILSFVSCGESFRQSGEDLPHSGDDSTLSGKVTIILNNLSFPVAYANEEEERTEATKEGERIYNVGTEAPGQRDENLVLKRLSSTLMSRELIGMRDNTGDPLPTDLNGYVDLTLRVLSEFESGILKQGISQSALSVSGLSSSASDFAFGLGVALGFNNDSQIVSIVVFPMEEKGAYKFKDSKESLVSYYRLSFLFENLEGVQFRKSFVFMDGATKKEDVDYAKTAAALEVQQSIASNANLRGELIKIAEGSSISLTAADLKAKMQDAHTLVKSSIYESSEKEAVTSLLKVVYDRDFETKLTPMEKTAAYASILFALRKDDLLRSALVQNQSAIEATEDFYSLSNTEGLEKLDDASQLIDRLVSYSILPGAQKNSYEMVPVEAVQFQKAASRPVEITE